MHKAGWVGWRKQNLYDRGRGKSLKLGWQTRYGFEKALRVYQSQLATPSLNSAQKLVQQIDEVRDRLAADIKVSDEVSEEKARLHLGYVNASIAALTKVHEAKDTLGAWVHFWERLLDWAVDIDAKLARTLAKYSDPLIERAQEEFGETQEQAMNADTNAADASGIAGPED